MTTTTPTPTPTTEIGTEVRHIPTGQIGTVVFARTRMVVVHLANGKRREWSVSKVEAV